MKICPKCNRQFGYEQRFCLEDGTLLLDKVAGGYDDEPATVLRTIPHNPQGNSANKIIFALIGLVAVLIIAFVGLFFWKQSEKPDANTQVQTMSGEKNTAQPSNQSTPNVNSQPTTPVNPESKLPPIQTSNMAPGTKYSGSIGNSPAVFSLNWNGKARTVSGSYYFTNNPSKIYTLSGTNFPDGEAELQEGGGSNARIKIYKDLKGKTLCWSGSYYGNNGTSSINFCRYR